MKNYPIVCPPLKIPSPHSHMSIYQRHSCFREVRITKGTIAESKISALLPGHFSICKTQPPTPTSTKNYTSTDKVKAVASYKRGSQMRNRIAWNTYTMKI